MNTKILLFLGLFGVGGTVQASDPGAVGMEKCLVCLEGAINQTDDDRIFEIVDEYKKNGLNSLIGPELYLSRLENLMVIARRKQENLSDNEEKWGDAEYISSKMDFLYRQALRGNNLWLAVERDDIATVETYLQKPLTWDYFRSFPMYIERRIDELRERINTMRDVKAKKIRERILNGLDEERIRTIAAKCLADDILKSKTKEDFKKVKETWRNAKWSVYRENEDRAQDLFSYLERRISSLRDEKQEKRATYLLNCLKRDRPSSNESSPEAKH